MAPTHKRFTVVFVVAVLVAWAAPGCIAPAWSGDLDPQSPAAFFPDGILGVQIGSPWNRAKRNPALRNLSCEQIDGNPDVLNEVCFFKTTAAGRVGGAEIHDGFIVRKGPKVVLIGTGIGIADADDPRAEAVMQVFQSQVHAGFQHTGADVLFVNMPSRRLSPGEMAGYARTAPVLLVELEPKDHELAIFYGYLAPVNAFSALASN